MKNPIEQAFWEAYKQYEGMKWADMEKTSHGRGFIAGWQAALRHSAQLINQIHDAESLRSDPSGLVKRGEGE